MVEKKKSPARGKQKDTAPDEEPVLVWSITGSPGIDEAYVGTEEEAESVRADYEGAKGGSITKEKIGVAEGEELERHRADGPFFREAAEEDEDAPASFKPLIEPGDRELADKLLGILRAAGKPLTVAELHTEVVADIPEGAEGYVPQGKVDAILKNWLLACALATQEGEAFVPVPPATLAKRRAERLAAMLKTEVLPLESGIASDVDIVDANALARAGLAQIHEDDESGERWLSLDTEQLEGILQRGAYASVIEAIAECREASAATVVTDVNAAAALGEAEAEIKRLRARAEQLNRDLGIARKALEKKTEEVETCRGWFRENNLPCPLDKPEVPKPPREEFTFSMHPDEEDKGRMYGIRLKLAARLADVDAELAMAKGRHKAQSEMLNGRIKALDDAVTGMFYDAPAFRRVDIARGVAQIVHVEDETWVLDEKELRSEQLVAEKAKADEAATPVETSTEAATPEAPAAPPADTMTVLPASEAAAAAAGGTLPTAGVSSAGPNIGMPFAAAGGTLPTAPPPKAAPAPKKKSAPVALTPETITGALTEIVGAMHPDDQISLRVAAEKIAERIGLADVPQSLPPLVKVAARKGHEKGLFRWWVGNGDEWLARIAAVVQPVADAIGAAAGAIDDTAKALEVLRAAGAAGLTRKDLAAKSGLDDAAIDGLIAAGQVAKNGKKGLGARLIAAEHAPKANGVSAEAQV